MDRSDDIFYTLLAKLCKYVPDKMNMWDKVARLGVWLVTSRSLVQFPAGALWSVLGQDILFHIASVYPAAKWVPRINKAVPRACALYAARLLWNIPRGIEMVSVCTGLLGEEGRVSTSADTRL